MSGQPLSNVAVIRRNSAWLFVAGVVGQGLSVVMTVLLASRVGLIVFGEYAFVSAIVFVANVATTFGTDMLLIRDIAGDRRLDRWLAALVIQLGLSGLVVGLMWLAAPFLLGPHDGPFEAARILSLTLLPSALFSVCTAVLRGAAMMRAYAAVGVASAAVPLGAVAAFVAPSASVVRVVTVLLVAQVAIGLTAWAVCAVRIPYLHDSPRLSWSEVGEMTKASASIGFLGLLGVLYRRTGAIALGLFAGPAATGWFAGAFRIVDAAKAGHVALFGAAYPAMAAAYANQTSPGSEGRDRGWSWRISVALGGLVSLALLALGPFAIDRLYGQAFGPAKTDLAILALTVIPSTIATYQSLAFLGARRECDTLRVLVISLGVLLTAMAVLIPTTGGIGACWAVLIADTAQAALMLVERARTKPTNGQGRAALAPSARARGEYG